MKKIINGKLYDTETATLVAYYSNYLSSVSPNWEKERLYKKRTGEFFLQGAGGELTKYARQSVNGMRYEGVKIIPITLEEAKEWVAQNCNLHTYIEVFGESEKCKVC